MKHHNLLHLNMHQSTNEKQNYIKSDVDNQGSNTEKTEVVPNVLTHHCTIQATSLYTVLLSTALIRIHRTNGQIKMCRVLLDSSSESHFISSVLVSRLHLKRREYHIVVGGVSTADT